MACSPVTGKFLCVQHLGISTVPSALSRAVPIPLGYSTLGTLPKNLWDSIPRPHCRATTDLTTGAVRACEDKSFDAFKVPPSTETIVPREEDQDDEMLTFPGTVRRCVRGSNEGV